MANYPTSLDSFTNPSSVDSLSAPSHSQQHSDANDAIEALEAKVGIGTSTAGSATAGHVLVASAGGTTSWTTVGASAINTTGGTAGQYLSAGTAGVASWATVTIPEPGLTQIVPTSIVKGASGSASVSTGGAVTFTGTESISLNGCFSSTYQNYRVIVNLSAVSNLGTNIFFRFRASGTDNTSNYAWGELFARDNGTSFATGNTNTGVSSAWQIIYSYGVETATSIDFYSPQEARKTLGSFIGWGGDSSTWYSIMGGGVHNTTNQFDGLTIYPSSGTIGGSIRVYGYKNG